MKPVTHAHLPAVTRFLESRIERAMFPLSNLRQYGLDSDAPYAPQLWQTCADGVVTGVFCQLRNKTVMPLCAPEASCAMLPGRDMLHLIGPTDLVRPVIETLDLAERPHFLNRDEPHCALDLKDLAVPEGQGTLRPLKDADPATMIAWRAADLIEALGYSKERARTESQTAYTAQASSGLYRVLMDGAVPLAVTGFNATLPDIVQIGGVYTPPDRRNRGHARRAVALHLAEARARGIAKATLFSNSPAALRAYEAIGFRRIGGWTLLLRPEAARV